MFGRCAGLYAAALALLLTCGMRAFVGLARGSTPKSTPFDGSEATQSASLPFNVAHLLIALAISGGAEIGTAKTAAAGSAEHDAVAAANKLRAAVVDRLAVDRHKAEPTGRAAAKPRGGDLGALDDKQRGDIVIAFYVDRDILAEPATVSSVAARAFAQRLVAEEDRVFGPAVVPTTVLPDLMESLMAFIWRRCLP
jgi:hypothetical protein